MWVVAKIKKKELQLFKNELIKKFDSQIKFYNPKIQYQKCIKNKIKKIDQFILGNYVFCYHEKLKQTKTMNEIKFLKGLEYFLQGYCENQNEIINFINYCKSFENKDGYLPQAFFKKIIVKKAQFVSGPFTNMIFEILKKQKNKLKILVGNVVTTISDNSNHLYRPV
tara:strand:+ start:209 stop:709 length:501 start_codon:yes stop_codon:yes gene_type:complete